MTKQDFLLELGCEEIPASMQHILADALNIQFTHIFSEYKLSFEAIKTFSTPRRLTVLVQGLETMQPPQSTERQGPPLQDAYDKNGTPTLVCIGFAKSSGVSVDQLTIKETPKGKRLVCLCKKPGQETRILLPEITVKAIAKLPISKPMRWGNHTISFIRPVHWVIMLWGDDCISTEILGVKTTRETIGHRFHHPKSIRISKPSEYSMLLYSQGFVLADFEARKNLIRKALNSAVNSNEKVVIDENLLNEVTGLVEWPVVLKGTFNTQFLSVPKEALITAMTTHQKCFPVVDSNNNLSPCFILVSNIISKDSSVVIKGNERVIHARLSDAQFFFKQDCKTTLINRLEKLNHIVFQDQLGSLGDKTERLMKLTTYIFKKISQKPNEREDTLKQEQLQKRAAQLSKCDLVTGMVGEFPNLQGIMGYYYALNDQESENIAIAISEQYLPKFSGDALPKTDAGAILAIADRIDTLIGILGINKIPTGDKDPFALRRAALGVIRILLEKKWNINLLTLLSESKKIFNITLPNENIIKEAFDFTMARLKSFYSGQGISAEVFEAVLACTPASLLDFDLRIKAVIAFQQLPESSSLAAANKRVNNILKKQESGKHRTINPTLFEFDAERELFKQLEEQIKIVNALYEKLDYEKALTALSTLKNPIDQFFESVMIMTDNEKKKQNRLSLLATIKKLFTKVADISLLP